MCNAIPDLEVSADPTERTRIIVGNRWKLQVLQNLMDGPKGFYELKKTMRYISHKVLVAELLEMEARGLLNKKIYSEVPPEFEYTLSEKGYSLRPVLNAMKMWGEDNP